MRDVEQLANTVGSREAGANSTAADYIVSQFSEARFGVLKSNFSFETDPNRPATLSIDRANLDAITAGGSKDGSVTAPAAALPTAIAKDSLSGKIAVTTRGGASFQEKYDIAWASGAVGLVIMNSDPGTVTANLGENAAFPVVTLPGTAEPQLTAAAATGATLTITVPPPTLGSGTNITARSRSAHACTYIVVANYDAAPNSAGANDNASGVAVMLELARQFDDRSPVPELCFVALDARFAGGQGAQRYLEALTASGRPGTVIAVSRLGAGGKLTMYGDLALKTSLSAIAKSLGIGLDDGGNAPPASTDGDEFRAAGISTIEIARTGGPIGRDDVFGKVNGKLLTEAGKLAGELALNVSAKSVP